jgi:hypothetical protein
MRLRAIVAILIGTVMSGGVATAGSATAGAVDPCALVSRAEAADAVGAEVGEAARFGTERMAGCAMRFSGGAIRIVAGVPGGDWLEEQIGRMARGVRMGGYREKGGMGERAFVRDGTTVAVLCVFEGRRYLQISVEGRHRAATLEMLARTALQRARSEAIISRR